MSTEALRKQLLGVWCDSFANLAQTMDGVTAPCDREESTRLGVRVLDEWLKRPCPVYVDGYHTLYHLSYCLSVLRDLVDTAAFTELTKDCEVAITIALFFHNASYDVRRSVSDNIAACLELADVVLGILLPGAALARRRIRTLIAATDYISCTGPRVFETQLIRDIDWHILSSSQEVYDEYRLKLRYENAHLSDAQWRNQRRAFLEGKVLAAFRKRKGVYYRLGRAADERVLSNARREMWLITRTDSERSAASCP